MKDQTLYTIAQISIGIVLGIVLTTISYAVALYAHWITTLDWLEISAVFTSYTCTYLCVVRSRWNYPFGFVSCILLSILFYNSGLFSSAALNAYLPFALLYGWMRWGKDSTRESLPVTYTPMRSWIVYVIITGCVYIVIVGALTLLDATLPIADTAILVLSILAQVLLDNKRIETWAIWIVINCIGIWLYYTTGLYLVAFQFVFFLINAIWAAGVWYKAMKRQTAHDLLWDT